MNTPQITAADAQRIRSPNAVGLFELAQERGWTDDEIAAAYNAQAGTGGVWTARTVATHRGWLQRAGMIGQPVREAGDTYLMWKGTRFNITPA